jgi:SEC-C motif-containing protein
MLCYCGSLKEFETCCQPFLNGTEAPQNSEQLMRSRYSAYAIKDADYIYNTYSKTVYSQNSLLDIKEWAEQCQWYKLEVIATELTDTQEQFVEFKACYIQGGNSYLMHEKSRFLKEDKQWRYVDGDIIEHGQVKKLNRNESCPCGSGKKYKRCCSN